MGAPRVGAGSHATQDFLHGVLLVGGLCALAIALATLPLPIAIGLVVGVAVIFVVLAQPLVGLVLLLLAVPFGSPFNIQIGGFNFGPIELLFALTMAAWGGRKVIGRDLPPPLTPLPFADPSTSLRSAHDANRGGGWSVPAIVWPLTAFLFVLAMTLTVTHSLPDSLKELLKWGEVLAVVLFVAQNVKRQHVPLLLCVLFVAAAVESAIGLYQTIANVGPEPFIVPLAGRPIMRSYGTFEQPNPFAAYLNFSLTVITSLLLGLLFEKGNKKDKGDSASPLSPLSPLISSHILLVVAELTLPVIAGASFFSLSRGAWLGFALAFVVMTALRSRRAFMALVVLAFVLAGLLMLGSLNVLPPAIADRIADIPTFFGLNLFDPRAVVLTNENFGIVDRMAHWFAAWNMFADFPWLGVGIGNYGVVYPNYGLREWPFSLGHAHNFYLNMLAEAGIVGLTFYFLLVVSALACAWAVARRSTGLWRVVALGVLGALVAMTVHNFFDNLYVHGMNIQFAFLLGILATLRAER